MDLFCPPAPGFEALGFARPNGRRQLFGGPSGARPARQDQRIGAVAQLGEHLLCKQGVSGSIPLSSTNLVFELMGYPFVRKQVCGSHFGVKRLFLTTS
jgi:hypothetical protein